MKKLFLILLVVLCGAARFVSAQEWEAEGPPVETDPAGADSVAEALEPDVMPELVEFINAEYPPQALKDGVEGTVLLELLIDSAGVVDSVAVIESLEPTLDAAAAAAAARFQFTPARAGGEPVPVLLLFEYDFSIREEIRRIGEYVNFSGTLKERGTKDPVAYATVVVSFDDTTADGTLAVPWRAYLERIGGFDGQFLEEGNVVALTDTLGRFAFRSLPAGQITITFPNAGYEKLSETALITHDEKLEATYYLPRLHYDEYEIVVYGKGEQKEVTRQRLSVTEVERIPGFGGDAIKSVQALPGVARPNFISGDIIVRGSGIEDTRYFLDGIDIPLLFHYGGVKSTYNSNVLESIDLYPGGFNTRYGNCVGGVIEITGRKARGDRWRRTVDMSLLDGSFLVEGPLAKNLTLSVTGRRSFVGEVIDAALRSGNFDDMNMSVVPYYWDTVSRLDWRRNRNERFFLTLFAAKDRMELKFPEEKEGSSEVNAATDAIEMDSYFGRAIFGYDRDFTKRARNELRLAIGNDLYEGHFFGYFNYKFASTNYTLRDEFSFRHNDRITSRLGADMAWYPLEYTVRAVDEAESKQEKDFSDFGYYANLETKIGDRLLLIPGYRYDYYHELEEGAPSARLTAQYKLSGSHTLRGAVGTYNQSPAPRGQSVDPVYGNPELPPTTATHAVLGDEWRISDLVSLKTEAYYNTQDEIPQTTDSSVVFLPDTKARMYGIEFMLRRQAGNRFFGWISYSLSRSERQYARKPSVGIEGEWDPDDWMIADYDQTHHIEAVGSWNLGSTWSTGIRMRYVTGNPATPSLGYTSDQYQFNSDDGDYEELLGDFRSDRMGPFFQLDARVDKKLVYEDCILSFYLDVQNVNYFAYNSPELYNYNFDYSERNTVGSLFLPTVGMRAEF